MEKFLPLQGQKLKKYKNLAEYKADQLMGQASEKQTLIVIRTLLNDTSLRKSKGDYAVLDFTSRVWKLKCEVKSRRNKKDTYATTMLGLNKIELAERLSKGGYTILFFFDFEDGLYYFNFNAWETITKHPKYERKMGGTYRRGLREMKMYCWVPVDCLTKCFFGKGSIGYTKTRLGGYFSVKQNRRIEVNTKL